MLKDAASDARRTPVDGQDPLKIIKDLIGGLITKLQEQEGSQAALERRSFADFVVAHSHANPSSLHVAAWQSYLASGCIIPDQEGTHPSMCKFGLGCSCRGGRGYPFVFLKEYCDKEIGEASWRMSAA